MARKRSKNSEWSFGGYGLKPEEDEKLKGMLKEADLSAGQVVRALLRQWIAEGGKSILRHSTK